MYVIVKALKKWRNYIIRKSMVIHIDHKPLQFAPSSSKLQTTKQLKWISYLQKFELLIKAQKRKIQRSP